MESWLTPNDDGVPDEFLMSRYPVDGYEALGQLLNDLASAAWRRWRAARRRRRELQVLRAAFALPSHDPAASRPVG